MAVFANTDKSVNNKRCSNSPSKQIFRIKDKVMTKISSKSLIVYARIELSNGKFYIFLAPQGKTSVGGLIDIVGGYSLTGPAILHAFDEKTGAEVGISTEAFVTVNEVSYRDADNKWLNKSREDYEYTGA